MTKIKTFAINVPKRNAIYFLVTLLCCSFLLTFCQKKEKTYEDYYSFKPLNKDTITARKGWRILPKSLLDINQEKIDNEDFLCIKPKKDKYGIQWSISADLSQGFLLQNCKIENNIGVEITTKGKHIANSLLLLKGVDSLGNETFSDTLSLKNSSDWETLKHSTNAPLGTSQFFICLNIRGENTVKDQFFSLKEIKIYLNGIDLSNLILEGGTWKKEHLKRTISAPYEKIGRQLSEIVSTSKAKVIAFGESLHGSKEFPDIFFQLFRHQVENNQVRLVLLERPIVEMMRWNRFVTDSTSVFTLDSLTKTEYLGLLDPDFAKKILLWAKEYNKNTSKKIVFAGIDYQSIGYGREVDLGSFLYDINTPQRNPLLDTLFLKLDFSSHQKTLETLKFVESNEKQLRFSLNEGEYEVIHKYMQNILQFSSENISPISASRELWMFQAAKQHINQLKSDEKALVYSHWLHTNNLYSGEIASKNLGGYLLNEYGSQYFRIGALASEGTFLGRGPKGKYEIGTLSTKEETLTDLLNKKQDYPTVFSPFDVPKIVTVPLYGALNLKFAHHDVVRLSEIINIGLFIKKVNVFTPNQTKEFQWEGYRQSIIYRDRKKYLLSSRKK